MPRRFARKRRPTFATKKRKRFGRMRRRVARGYGPARATVSRQIGTLQGNRVRMRYVETHILSSPIGVMDTEQYYANGLWDPRVAALGHQPMGFDNAMNYYQYAVVYGSKITVKFISKGITSPCVCGIYLGDNVANPYTDWTVMKELGYPMKNMNTDNSGTSSQVTVTAKFSHKKFFGQNLGQITDTANTSTANCTRLSRYNVWLQTSDAANNSGSAEIQVCIDFLVRLFNPLPQQQN